MTDYRRHASSMIKEALLKATAEDRLAITLILAPKGSRRKVIDHIANVLGLCVEIDLLASASQTLGKRWVAHDHAYRRAYSEFVSRYSILAYYTSFWAKAYAIVARRKKT